MRSMRGYRFALLCSAGFLTPLPAAAQALPAAADPAVSPTPSAITAGSKQVFTPADFARFAPRTAYDMLVQVPGFNIRAADKERGLGQASENVLINGERIANKSGGAVAELQNIGISSVQRIEIVDAASLGIAGLTGQVANVIVARAQASSGQFEWTPEVRAHYAEPRLFSGVLSYSGNAGPVGYTFSLKNDPNRGAFGGPITIYDPLEQLTERRDEVYHGEGEYPTASGRFKFDGPGSSVGNLNLAYTPYWGPAYRADEREPVDGVRSSRLNTTELKGWYYDVSGDFEFAAGPGRLKLIGLRHFDHEPLVITQTFDFEDDSPSTGNRFSRDSRIAETVGRGEYRWKTGLNDWQISLERAHNSLDQRGRYFELSPDGAFEEIDYPQGTGKVTEVRYEAIGTLSRPLASNLDLQIAAGAEHSRLHRVDGDIPPRKFFRPKGSLTLGWRPAEGWDASLKINRRVGQISFYDFLDQPKLSEDRENSGNPDLVPPQSWEFETEVGRDLGEFGKTRLRTWYHRIDDIIDIIPIGETGQGVGNIPRASKVGAESVSTFQLDPMGWTGAKIDLAFGGERTRVRDPLTGELRHISGTQDAWISSNLRHDIPGSQLAWGASASYSHFNKNYYLTEVFRSWEGPWWLGVFVEHKNILGLTVRADAGNLLNARHRLSRYVYEGRRDSAPLDYIQRANQLIGPIFSLSVKGNF